MRRWTFLLSLAAVVAGVAALSVFEAGDPDLGFHLATGRAILEQGTWLDRNVLSFAQPDQPWVLQQGVPAVIFESLWQVGGVSAVILTKAVVVVATFVLVFLAGVRLRASPTLTAAVVLLAAWSCAFRFVERPLIFSNLMLAVVIYAVAGAATSVRHRPIWLTMAGLAVACACNLHAGAVFSIIALVIVAVSLLLDKPVRTALKLSDPNQDVLPPQRKRGAAWVAITVVAGMGLAFGVLATYHPFPFRVLEVPFVMGSDPFLAEHLIEFRGPWRFPMAIMKGYWVFLVLTVGAAAWSWRRTPIPMLALVVAFAVLSLRYVRFADAFAIVAAPVTAVLLGALWQRMPARMAPLLVVVLMVLAPMDHWSLRSPRLALADHAFATQLLDRIERWGLRGPAFVSDGWAGPFLARRYPEERVYFFPAFDAFSRSLYEEYVDIRYGRPGWQERLDHYGIELCLLKYTSPGERRYQKGADNLRQHLAASPDWTLMAFDDLGEIFVRAGGVNAAQAELRGLSGIDPDRMQLLSDPGAFLERLKRVGGRLPPSVRQARLIQMATRAAGATSPPAP